MSRNEQDMRDHYASLPTPESGQQRLEEWIEHTARGTAAGPPQRHRRLAVVGTVAAVAVVALGAGLVASRLGTTTSPAGTPDSTGTPGRSAYAGPTFLTIQGRTGDGYASQLQLRAADDGRVLAVLFHAPHGVQMSADQAPDGSILVAATTIDTCRTTLSRIDPQKGRSTVIARFPEWVSDLSASPDGGRVAFTTYATCPGPFSNLARFFPSVLAIRTLATGAEVRTATPQHNGMPTGNPFFGVAWSPDSSTLVAGYSADRDRLLLIDARQPDFGSARWIPAPAGCQYYSPAWSISGILAVRGCHEEAGLSPSRLVLLDPSGQVRHSWTLPECIDGVGPVTDPSGRRTFLQTDIGYGNGRCAAHFATRIWHLETDRLTPVFTIGEGASVELVG